MRPPSPEAPPTRRAAAAATVLVLASGALLLPVAPALAADGPAPAPHEHRVLADIHTDAISTFIDDGQLRLATKADVSEGDHTRFEAESVWFHIDNDALMTLPAGFDFIAASGADVWMAPQVQNHETLWPGFSTESVPAGTLDGNSTTLTLVGVDGPGDVELFENGAFGQVTRIWSSDEAGFKELTVGANVHKHANWAFTEAGSYALTVRADASIDGVPHTDTAVYTFVVGDVPADVATSTTIDASATDLLLGESTTLSAAVTPEGAAGYVEFREGDNVLGHEPVVDGEATFAADSLSIGVHALTAVFVPEVENLADASTSTPVEVTVSDGTGLDFGIRGFEDSYEVGDTLDLSIVGYTLEANEEFRWAVSHPQSDGSSWYLTTVGQQLELEIDVRYDGYVFRGVVYDTSAGEIVAQTASKEVEVTSLAAAPTLTWVDGPDVYLGSAATATVATPEDLEEGDTVLAAFRQRGAWLPSEYAPEIEGETLTHALPFNMTGQVHLQVMREGLVIAQSEPYPTTHQKREVLLEGSQGVYRAGQTLMVSGTVFPMADNLSYEWRYRDGEGNSTTTEATADESGAFTFEREMILEDDGGNLTLSAKFPNAFGFASTAGSGTVQVHVSDAAPGEQIVALDSLAGHYHQGNTISLRLSADPAIADTDAISWEWRWTGGDWKTIDGFDNASEQLVAEQALDGVEVRATLTIDQTGQSFTTDPLTIHVDDHGAPADQQVTIDGLAEHYEHGDEVLLTASVDPASVLDRWEWFVQREGEDTPMLVEDEHDSTLSFTAVEDLDGAAVFARLTLPDGSAYVESAPVLLDVAADPGPVTTVISISGLAAEYEPGDTMTLAASQDPATGEDHWHWFIKPSGGAEYLVIPGETSSTLTRPVSVDDDGAMIVARLYNHDHEVIAESAPVTVRVTDAGANPGETEKPTDAPEPRTLDALEGTPAGGLVLSSTSVAQGQVFTIDIGGEFGDRWVAAWLFSSPRLLNGDWTRADDDGVLAVRVPQDAEVGNHQVAVFAADGSLIGWADIAVTAADGTIPTGALPRTGIDAPLQWIGLSLLVAGAGAVLMYAQRRRQHES